MLLVQVGNGIPPQQVDDFGKEVERSVAGALYFRPNTLRSLTKGELEHIQRAHPHLAAKLRVVRDTEQKKKPAPAPKASVPAFSMSSASASASSEKKDEKVEDGDGKKKKKK